ncbi:HlyD family efflux transporter periplasmic adaptor subunit [Amphritea opalescens]|uniref:HlyD family efflux transporter periplasmic adaptor subunit n=1 Tax=Amphritea opalescens TaxID=2490544 RepID=A0A430KSG1_9GAMM|nr:HlyD family efflux transporter periplasmic adaptor subunit [Amphritea opalescens]RTE66263.1 HlyD family efflux transporter periplasmic adaptor subunit [Amphritea opalescens]
MLELDRLKGAKGASKVRPALWLCCFVVIIFIVWAAFAKIDEVTRGDGRIIPSSRLQLIQSLEGGIIDKLLVHEGEMVEAGQPLIELDKTRFFSAYREGESQSSSLRASIARLEAEVQNHSQVTFPEDQLIDSKDIAVETSFFEARREKKQQTIASLRHKMSLVRDELKIIRPLVADGAVSQMEQLRLDKEVEDLNGQIVGTNKGYMQDAYAELTQKKAELNALTEKLVQKKDQLLRTVIKSPVRGMVNDILVTTKGGIVQPGEAIMKVLPIDEQLVIEAKIKPKDIAFLAPGMPAKIKITAYDYTIYGDLEGEVVQISPDTIEEETAQGKEFYYQILVHTTKNYLEKEGVMLPIRPGMIAQVDILGGKRTILNYILNPLLKARLN